MPSPLQRVEAVAKRRREAIERAERLTGELLERVEEARPRFTMQEIANAAGMTRTNLYKVVKRRSE